MTGRWRPAPATGPGEAAAVLVGAATLAIGGALVALPGRAGRVLAVDGPTAARVVGALDLALVPGLLLGPRRPLWLLGRAALNIGIAAHVLRTQRHTSRYRRAGAVSALLAVATVADSRTVLQAVRAST